MRIGIIVDGQSEFASLPLIIPELERATGNVLLGPAKADIHPKAPMGAIAHVCLKSIEVLKTRDIQEVIVLMDREDRDECPGVLAQQIQAEVRTRTDLRCWVVIKNRTYENWLVADLDSLRAQPGRFRVTRASERQIAPNKADNCNALAILKRSAIVASYSKVSDSMLIMRRAEVQRIADNSRSFRRFLRCVEYPRYADQSRNP